VSDFADYEPEDAWDVDDDPYDMARNLRRRLDALDQMHSSNGIDEMIAEIEHRVAAYRRIREQLSKRDQLRLDQLIEDLPVLREKARHA